MAQEFSQITNFIWGTANLIRDTFKRGKYQDVILPLTVLRRLDCVLEPTKDKVLNKYNSLKGKLDNLDPQLRRASGHAFYNTSRFTFETLLQDSANIAANLRAWINGFSENMREVLEKFDEQVSDFSQIARSSEGRLDKLFSDTQITLLKFDDLGTRIDAIQDDLRQLEEFNKRFDIA